MIALYAVAVFGFAAPPAEVHAAAAPYDIQAGYDGWRATKKLGPQPLACEVLWTGHAQLCFRWRADGKRQWATRDDLTTWTTSTVALRSAATAGSAAWVANETEWVAVSDLDGRYLRLRDGDGRAVLGALAPEALEAAVGSPLAVAIPSTGVLLAWKAGDRDFDHAMVVGVRELHDQARDPVTAVAFRWIGGEWVPWVEATHQEKTPSD